MATKTKSRKSKTTKSRYIRKPAGTIQERVKRRRLVGRWTASPIIGVRVCCIWSKAKKEYQKMSTIEDRVAKLEKAVFGVSPEPSRDDWQWAACGAKLQRFQTEANG